jgi:serine/threonine protein kinase
VGNGVARTVGRYEILEELGRGGMATVYLARQTDLDRLVALKELSSFRQSDPAFTRRFLRESRLAGSLSHPNIVTVHDYFENEGAPYIAMEYVSRGSLRPHIGQLPLTQAAGVLEGILAALGYAEQHHIVHRDLKPENVMVTEDGRVKLTDFGIAKASGQAFGGSFLTAAGTTVGTPNYMAPEQAMGQEVGPWTDLYSVGVMAFEMFVGEVPFHDTEEPMAILMRQVSDPIPPAHSLNPDLDPAISDWIERLLVKEPEQRIQSAGEAWDRFEEIVLDLVGPRWRRSARLPALSTTVAGPHPTLPTAPRRDTISEVPTRRVRDRDEAALAPTVMPTRPRDRVPEPGTRPGDRDPELSARPRRKALVKGGVALLAALAAAAAAFGNRGADPGGSPRAAARAAVAAPTISVSGAELALKVPRGWSRMGSAPDLGLPLSRPVAVVQRRGSALPMIEFGVMKGDKASNSTLLPAAFLGAIGQPAGTAPSRTAVRLPAQRLEAWRYRNLRPAGIDRQMTVYAVPTTGGVATVACTATPARATAFEDQCEAVAGSLELRDARPYPVGPSETYANALNSTTGNLQQDTRAAEASLQAARTLSAQAAAARTLADNYETAAAQLADLDLSPADRDANRRLVSALRRLGQAYRRVARAATAGDATRYRAVSAAIPAAKARVNAALAGVRAAGYQPAAAARPKPPPAAQPEPSTNAPSSTPRPSDPEGDVGDSQSDDPSDDEDDDSGEP